MSAMSTRPGLQPSRAPRPSGPPDADRPPSPRARPRPRSPLSSPSSARCSRAVSLSRVTARARSLPQKLRISSMARTPRRAGGSRHSFEPLGAASVIGSAASRESSLARAEASREGCWGLASRAHFRHRGRTSGVASARRTRGFARVPPVSAPAVAEAWGSGGERPTSLEDGGVQSRGRQPRRQPSLCLRPPQAPCS